MKEHVFLSLSLSVNEWETDRTMTDRNAGWSQFGLVSLLVNLLFHVHGCIRTEKSNSNNLLMFGEASRRLRTVSIELIAFHSSIFVGEETPFSPPLINPLDVCPFDWYSLVFLFQANDVFTLPLLFPVSACSSNDCDFQIRLFISCQISI